MLINPAETGPVNPARCVQARPVGVTPVRSAGGAGFPPSPHLRTPTTARLAFAREAFGESLIGYDEARLGAASPG